MRHLRALGIYVAFIFLGGALIAPWLWHLGQLLAPWAPKIAASPFHRYLDRSFLVMALVGIRPLMRALGGVSLAEIGIIPPYEQMGKLFGGLLMGIVSLAIVVGIELVTGHRSINPALTAWRVVNVIVGAVLAAAIVGTLEEVLFRGAIFGWLRHTLQWPAALLVSSMIFAVFHFFRRVDIAGPVQWNSGFILLPQLFDFQSFIPGFLCLTLIGVILALAYQSTGTLYFSVGLHAGWIFILKIYGGLTVMSPTTSPTIWGTNRMWDGWLTFMALIVTLAVFKLLPLQKRQPYTIT